MADTLTFNDLLEAIARLSVDEQGMIVEIVRNRVIEQRREDIAENSRIAHRQYAEGKLKRGTVDDLEHDLLNEE